MFFSTNLSFTEKKNPPYPYIFSRNYIECENIRNSCYYSNKQYMNLYCVYLVYNLFYHFHSNKLFWTIRIMWSYVDTISACLIVKLPQVYPFYKTFPSYLMLVTRFNSLILISAPNICCQRYSVAVEETQYGI